MSQKERSIIDETSVFLNNRGVPIAKSRDRSALYAFQYSAQKLLEVAAQESELEVVLPMPPSHPRYPEIVRSLVNWLQQHQYGPKGQEITWGVNVGVEVRTAVSRYDRQDVKRLIILNNDIGIWKRIKPPSDKLPQ